MSNVFKESLEQILKETKVNLDSVLHRRVSPKQPSKYFSYLIISSSSFSVCHPPNLFTTSRAASWPRSRAGHQKGGHRCQGEAPQALSSDPGLLEMQLQADLEFVKKITRPNFRVKEFYTLKMRKSRLFLPAINSENASLSVIWPSFG